MFKKTLLLILLFAPLQAITDAQRKTTWSRLDPTSVRKQLAFYSLYPETPEGKKALHIALRLLKADTSTFPTQAFSFDAALQGIIALVNDKTEEKAPLLDPSTLSILHVLGKNLSHHQLKGHTARSEAEVLLLNPDEIDIGRALLLSQLGPDFSKIESYEATLDLMALEILSTIPPKASLKEKIHAMNAFIFEELEFRFPPHSAYAESIDEYTFLPNVLDSRRGVCLGVSLLYLSIAQRLGIPLEIITPPGHIYVRCPTEEGILNIETTARGIHLEDEVYLSVSTRKLQERTLKEAIGLAFINQASVFWMEKKYAEALDCYKRALPYLPHDPLTKELMAYNYYLLGEEESAKKLLASLPSQIPDHLVTKDSLSDEILSGKIDKEGVASLFLHVDETRISILQKKAAIEETTRRCPASPSAWQHLGMTLLQLYREGEALEALSKAHDLDPTDPTNEYMLSVLNAKRLNYPAAWNHLLQAEKLTDVREHHPKTLKELRFQLSVLSPLKK